MSVAFHLALAPLAYPHPVGEPCNIACYGCYGRMAFILAFLEPQYHWPKISPPPALGQSGGDARRRGWPLGRTPQFRRTRGGLNLIPDSEILLYRYNSATSGTKIEFPSQHRPARCGKNPIPRADR